MWQRYLSQNKKTNRVEKLKINDIEFVGTKFRELLKLRSTDFDIQINNNEVINMLIEENIYLKIKETNIFKNKKPLLL